jgi:cell fate (sporulation/competence/biofilm development) regulator YlbF (YheA/YmcA/DUF963 family)
MTALALPAIENKIQELCNAIAAEPEIHAAREQAEAFLADEEAVALYRELMTLGRSLEQRDRLGESISQVDADRFEDLQDQAESHAGIRGFNDAQQVLQGVANMVNAFVSKTLEKGKVPTTDEVFGQGGCGEGCGCHS